MTPEPLKSGKRLLAFSAVLAFFEVKTVLAAPVGSARKSENRKVGNSLSHLAVERTQMLKGGSEGSANRSIETQRQIRGKANVSIYGDVLSLSAFGGRFRLGTADPDLSCRRQTLVLDRSAQGAAQSVCKAPEPGPHSDDENRLRR